MKRYKTALLIGRFQPFHKGHLYLITKALYIVEKLIIGIGSANMLDEINPLNIETRKKMMKEVIKHETKNSSLIKVITINDYHDDEKWLKETLDRAGSIDVIVGNNEWVNGIFEKAGYPVKRFPYFKRYIYEGVKIRKLMKEGNRWEKRVPNYLVPFIKYKEPHV